MESDTLAKVLQAEREIEMKIAAAKKTCDEQIWKARQDAEQTIAQKESVIREQCMKKVEEAEKLAEAKAAALIAAETRRAEKISSLSDETLKRIAMKHLVSILPGERHDRTHVQN